MNENAKTHTRGRKTISAVLAVAMAATMLLSGTLAYYYRTKATNTLGSVEKKVVGHDDLVVAADGLSYNKDIYVENIGETNVYVRVQLQEDFTLNGKKIVDTLTHIPAITADGSTDVTLGTATGDSNSGEKDIHKYFTWTMGNTEDEVKTYRSAEDPIALEDNVAKDNTGVVYAYADGADFIRKTDYGPVITLTAYKKLAENADTTLGANIQQTFVGWVIDETTGWAYWSQMLKPREATGMLLNAVTMTEYGKTVLPNADYAYNIHVNYEAVDEFDLRLWLDESENTDAFGKRYAEGEIAKIPADSVVRTLLTNAKAMTEDQAGERRTLYSASIIDARHQSYKAIANSTSEGAKLVYKHVLNEPLNAWLLAPYDCNANQTHKETGELLYQLGKKVEQNTAGKDDVIAKKTSNGKYYISTDGQPLVDSSLPAADTTGIGPILFANEANIDGDDVITRGEAQALTWIDVKNNKNLKSVESLNKAVFPNLFRLELTDTGLTSIDFANMSKNIRGLRLQMSVNRVTTQQEIDNLSTLTVNNLDSLTILNDLILQGYDFQCNKDIPLTNLYYFALRYGKYSGRLDFKNSKIQRLNLCLEAVPYFNGTLDLRDLTELENCLIYGGFGGNGVIDLSTCKKLKELILFFGSPNYGPDVSITAKLHEACKTGLEKLEMKGDVSVHYTSTVK